ncbi:MAG: murein biosynthesis integral membrane protein MurJ [Gemmatimonadetes bacterium]|nr:murein biosynthesis integral membrane protein MurJ [Gemmatimonadota bacterium]
MTTPTDDPPTGSGREARAATRVGAGIFLSRLMGFVRERLFAHFFGSSDFADAWRAAFRLPNVLRNLLGEGTLSASMVPIYSEFLGQGKHEEANRFAGAVLGLLTVVSAAAVLLGVMIAPLFVPLFFPRWSPEKQAITTTLVRILLPMSGILVISAWAIGILDSHRRFFVSYVAPVFWNITVITAMVAGGIYWGLGQRDLVVVLAWGALIGGGVQLAVQLPFVLRLVHRVQPSMGRGVEGIPEGIRNFGPVVAARGVVNLSGWFELYLAGLLANGAVAVMGYAQTFYLLPISLFGISVAASELPELSRMRGEDREVLAARVAAALRRVSYFVIPSAIAYLALGDVVIAALYETGEFRAAQTLVTWGVLAAFALGLPVSACSRALSSVFYALRDTKTPARIAYVRVLVSIVIGVIAMIPLDRYGFSGLRLGAAGLAMGASCAAWVEFVMLRRALARKIGAHGPGAGPIVRLTLAASLAAALGVALQLILPPAQPWVVALETLLPFGVLYLVATALLGQGINRRRST